MDINEYAATLTTGGPQSRQALSKAVRTVLQGIRDRHIDCFYCGLPAVILRHSVGRALPLCRQHVHGDQLDRQIGEQRARAGAMRHSKKRTDE
jgi:hypothetical protein